MKKIITATLTLSMITALMADANVLSDKKEMKVEAYAEMEHKSNKSNYEMQELVPLPHFKRLLAANKEVLALSEEQNNKIKTQIFKNLRTKIHGAIKKAAQLELKITNSVLKEQKTKEDLKADIETLIDLKRDITNGHIDAINILAQILTKEQYEKLLIIIKKNKKYS